jgi:hypothetical protein
MKIGIYNNETGEQEVRDMTPEEVADIEADAVAAAEKKAAKEAQAAARAAVLEKLGLTEEEVTALLA